MDIYHITKLFPRDELYSLATQLRCSVVAIPVNIAEGQARLSGVEFYHFLGPARGALVEVETELMIAQNLEYLSAAKSSELLQKASELGKILNGLIGSIRPAA
jgi:four helix bundle protein